MPVPTQPGAYAARFVHPKTGKEYLPRLVNVVRSEYSGRLGFTGARGWCPLENAYNQRYYAKTEWVRVWPGAVGAGEVEGPGPPATRGQRVYHDGARD